SIRIDNPQPHPLTLACAIDGWTPGAGRWVLEVEARGSARAPQVSAAQAIGSQRQRTEFGELTVPSGPSTLILWLQSDEPAAVAPSADGRELGVCVFHFELAAVE